MHVKKYLVNSIEEAEASILHDLGPTAMILSTRPLLDSHGSGTMAKIEVIAGAERAAAQQSQIKPKKALIPSIDNFKRTLIDLESLFDPTISSGIKSLPVYRHLINRGIATFTVQSILQNFERKFGFDFFRDEERLKRELKRVFVQRIHTTGPILIRKDTPQMVALIGPPGSGKTTGIIKLALQYRDKLFKNVGIISHGIHKEKGDVTLRDLSKEYQLALVETAQSNSLLEALDGHKEQDLILIDTPGTHYEESLAQLSSLKGLQMHIVIAANSNENEVVEALKSYKAFDPAALIFTKLDQVNTYSKLFNLVEHSAIPVSYIGNSPKVTRDFEIADPEALSDLILGNGWE